MFLLIISFVVLSTIDQSVFAHWSYGNIGRWASKDHYCGGKSQSPIDLVFSISKYDRRLRPLHIERRPQFSNGTLINNGHTAQINMKHHFVVKHLFPQSEDYIVEQIHFHWGDSEVVNGSEHLLEGRAYPLEMHMVSYSSMFTDIVSAMSTTRGLAVIGLFFEIVDEPNPLLDPLISDLAKVLHKGDRVKVNPNFDVRQLIGPDRLRRYYRYDGSLTTPPCYESVIWNVLHEPVQVSRNQIEAFRHLHDEQKSKIINTYRPVQPLNTRNLLRSFALEDPFDERNFLAMNTGTIPTIRKEVFYILQSLLMIMI